MKKIITFLIFIGIIISGCSYEFSSDNFIDISKPKIEENIINLNNFKDLDTINIQSQLVYTYKGKSNQFLVESKLYIDNHEYGLNMDGNIGTFTIYPSAYADGIHTIRIENKFTSGSGSIADQAQSEFLKATEIFKFVVHRKPSSPPNITEATVKDGSITVKWALLKNPEYKQAYLSLKFKKKERRIPLTKEMLELGSYIDKNTVLFPANNNTPDYDEYLSVTYSIIYASNYTELYSSNKTVVCDPSWFNMKISYNNSESYKVKWSSYPLYANAETFEIREGIHTFIGSSKGGEYIINSPYVFGKEYNGSAQPQSQSANYSIPIYSFYNMELDKDTFGQFNFDSLFSKNILYNPINKHYYALIIEKSSNYYFDIYVYEYSEEMVFLKKKYIDNYNSPRHEYIQMFLDPINNNFYIDARHSSYMIDKSNLNVLQKYVDPPNTSELSLRNDILTRWEYSTHLLTIINRNTNTVIFSGTTVNGGYLSRNGKYVYISTETSQTIFEIINNQLIKVMDVNIYIGNIEIENDTLFYTNNNEVFMVDLNTKTTKSFVFGTYEPTIQFDPYSQKLLLTQNGYNGIYDLTTKQISLVPSETNKNATGTFSSEDRHYFLSLQNGRLIHSKGIYIDIN